MRRGQHTLIVRMAIMWVLQSQRTLGPKPFNCSFRVAMLLSVPGGEKCFPAQLVVQILLPLLLFQQGLMPKSDMPKANKTTLNPASVRGSSTAEFSHQLVSETKLIPTCYPIPCLRLSPINPRAAGTYNGFWVLYIA